MKVVENGQIICGYLQSITVGIEDMFLKALVPDDIHDDGVAAVNGTQSEVS